MTPAKGESCPHLMFLKDVNLFPKITQEKFQLVQLTLAKYLPYTVVAQ
jgi:hypothetical protein